MTADRAVLIAAVFVLAGMVKGLIGLGPPTIAIGLLGLVMPPREAAVLLLLPSIAMFLGLLMGQPVLPAQESVIYSLIQTSFTPRVISDGPSGFVLKGHIGRNRCRVDNRNY